MTTVLTVNKVIDLIEVIAAEGTGLGTRELARRLDWNVATVHNIAQTMVARGYLRQNPENKRFEIGDRLALVSRHSQYLNAIYAAGKMAVQMVASEINESIMLVALDHGHVVNLHYVPSRSALRVAEPEDMTDVAHCTASGKLMLAQMTQQELVQYLDHYKLKNYTPQTITRRSELVDELNQIRAKGFSLSCDELCEGVSALAVPISDPWARVIAAIGAGVPTSRLNQAGYRKKIHKVLMQAAERIQKNIA